MAPVQQFAQYLLKLERAPGTERATLYHYLRHFVDANRPFTPSVIHAFYARALQFDHWRSNSENLSRSVRADVQSWLSQRSDERELETWAKVRHSDSLQLVPIKVFQDLEELVAAEHEDRQKSGDRLKLVQLSETQILLILLGAGGGVEVKVYPNLALVLGARLKLAAPITHLYYGPDLELMPHVRQTLEGSLLTTHLFHVDSDGVHGLVTRGYSFQKFETYIRASLTNTQELFASLKRLERHFVNPQSDPYYQEMVQKLERSYRQLDSGVPDSLQTAQRALNKARVALKNIFPNDRLLSLLVTHLEYGISQVQQPNAPGAQ